MIEKRSKALIEYLRQVIDQEGGCISFHTFMELALYHPEWGYYQSPTFSLGKTGDFTTAPEISPLFAQCFARQFNQIFDQIGKADFLELGAGSGQFAKDLLQKLSPLPDHYYIYEISSSLRQKQQALLKAAYPDYFSRIIWLDQLPTRFNGIIFANEVLDALPVDCFRIENQTILERCVSWNNDEFQWQTRKPARALASKIEKLVENYELPDEYESELNPKLPEFVGAMTDCLEKGVIFFADYGYSQHEYYHPERNHGTLTCFYQHKRHANPLVNPGLQDITAHVDFTEVIEIAAEKGCKLGGYTTQAGFLLAAGLIELMEALEPQLSTIDRVNLSHAIKLLTLPTEMGEVVKIMALTKNLDIPLLGFRLQDRRRDL